LATELRHPAAGAAIPLTRCIVCRGEDVEEFLDLGGTALANKFRSAAELECDEPHYPLKVGFCHGCGHVQLLAAVPPPAMFEDYLYVSSASATLRDHLYELSDLVVERFGLGPSDLVIDIGCNDETLLKGFRRHDVRTLGVDPAQNLAELAGGEIERYVGFFDSQSAAEILERYGPAAAITATNTFPHIPALHDFMAGIDRVLAPGGVFVIEAHYVVDMVEQGAFDTVYHEHVSYWALGPMRRLFESFGLEVVDAERLPIHHGQLRVSVMRQGEGVVQPSVSRVLASEHEAGIDDVETFRAFAARALEIRREVVATLAALRARGARIAGYGAPAKGNTLLSFLGLGPETIEYIVDVSPLKQGLYTPNVAIPIVPAERLLTDQPDYVLLLAWNFTEEILAQQHEYLRRGGTFVVPVPEVAMRSLNVGEQVPSTVPF
jgi:SAM-dependent methyltransferase